MFKNLFIFSFVLVTSLAMASPFPDDQPASDEDFTSFFVRITRGSTFRGIRLEAPESFQQAFYKRFLRGPWVGARDQVRKQIQQTGGDLWNNYYKSNKVIDLILNDSSQKETFAKAMNDSCKNQGCRTFAELEKLDWQEWTSLELQIWTSTYIEKAAIFGNKTILEFLAAQHNTTAETVKNKYWFRLLGGQDFEQACRELGWQGPIYFRGITGPDPQDPEKRWILMNADLMKKMTPFSAPLLQFLEYTGILTHEISHVFQDLEAKKYGLDLRVLSPEGILLIEGTAEYWAEQALHNAADQWPANKPKALKLFVTEAAIEILYRPGQESQGNLFPYTVGFPFAMALFDLKPNTDQHRSLIYQTIMGETALKNYLQMISP